MDENDHVQMALSIYHDEMVDRMAHHIAGQFNAKSSEMDGQVEVVVAGGSSMPPGFCKRLEAALKRTDMPFVIYQVRHSETPFHSVGQGACLRAQADYARAKK